MFHNLDADAISEVYFRFRPLRQPKDSGQCKNARGMSARRVITMSVLSDAYLQQTEPPAPVNLWVGGVVAGSCWLGFENCGQA